MGGGHHEPFKVPDWKIYNNYRAFPELVEHERRLAMMGLKDPWIRNFVWLYDQRNQNVWKMAQKSIFAGFGVGLIYATIAIVATETYMHFKKKSHGSHHQEGHGSGGDHHGH